MEQKQDVDKLKLLAEGMNDLVDVGEDVFSDGKVDLGDLQYLGDMGKASMKIIKSVKEYKEMYAEAKDIDALEAIEIVKALLGK